MSRSAVQVQSSALYSCLRACADRDATPLNGKRTRDARSFGELPSFPMKERTCARTPTIPHRAHLATVLCPAARKEGGSSIRLSPPPHTRPGGLREARASVGVRLRLPQDRRRRVLGNHASPAARRVDRDRGDGYLT